MSRNVSIVNICNNIEDEEGERERLIFKRDIDGPINSDIKIARNKNGKHFGK